MDEPRKETCKNHIKKAQEELLNWFMQLLGSGMTVSMIRLRAQKKLQEINEEKEKQ